MTTRGIAAVTVGLLAIAALLSGCGTTSTPLVIPANLPMPDPLQPKGDYVIRPGDTLDIRFYYHADHNQDNVLVRPDGKIDLPLIGEVKAADRTPGDLSRELVQRYASNLRAPEIAVRVKTEGIPYQPRVYVGGEVFKPGFVNLRPGMTVTQAVIEAGGPRDTAALDSVVLLRKVAEPNEYKPSRLDLAQVLEGRNSSDNIELGAADIVVLPKSEIAKLNVIVEQYIIKMIPFRFSLSPI